MIFGKKEKKQGKKETAKEALAQGTKPRSEPYEIRVMPPKFHQYAAKAKGGSLPKWLIFGLIGVVAVAGIGLGAYYLITLSGQPTSQPRLNTNRPAANLNQTNVNVNENININENANLNVNANENTNVNINENANSNVNINANVNENENINANANINAAPSEPEQAYFSSQDADKDSLTDVEEDLYGTEKRKPDTDADGFIDGQEIINGFNPKAAGSSLLANSGLVNTYSNPTFNYQILYIATWVARPTDQSLREIVFQSATGERINVLVEDNLDQLGLAEWYLKQSPLSNISDLEKKNTGKGYQALISPDKLTYYLVDSADLSKVYIITYQIDNKTSINFLTTFAMMINSFELKEITEAESEEPVAEAES